LGLVSCSYTSKITEGIFSGIDSEYNSLIVNADNAIENADFNKAEQFYEKAILLKPEEFTTKLKLARAYQQDGKLAMAYNRYQTIIEQAPTNKTDERIKEIAKSDQSRLGYKSDLNEVQEAKQEEKSEEKSEDLVPKSVTQITLMPEGKNPVEILSEPIPSFSSYQ
jgi:tetratricopeptide (TPR) repeat protein